MLDRHAEVMIRRHQSHAARDDAVPVMIGVAGKCDVEPLLQPHESLHRVGGRGIHADAAVPVQSHEAERGIDFVTDDREVQPVALGDRRPVVHPGAPERIYAQSQTGAADGVHVDHVPEIAHVGVQIVMTMCRRGAQRRFEGDSPHLLERTLQQLVGARLDPARDIAVGRATIRRVVLEPAIRGRVVRRGDDHAIGHAGAAATVVREDGVREHRRRRVLVVFCEHDLDAIGGEHLKGAGASRYRERVRIDAEEQRATNTILRPVLADRLADRQHVPFVERAIQRRSPMPRGTEGDRLRGHCHIGDPGVVRCNELRHVHPSDRGGGLAGKRTDIHSAILKCDYYGFGPCRTKLFPSISKRCSL